jgi:hypothetical protein
VLRFVGLEAVRNLARSKYPARPSCSPRKRKPGAAHEPRVRERISCVVE